jgi:hypothetical protein
LKTVQAEQTISPATIRYLAWLFPQVIRREGENPALANEVWLTELRRYSLTPLIYLQITNQDRADILDQALLQDFRNDSAFALKTAVAQENAALGVIQVLTQAGVDVILLKGADLRLRVYESPADRPMLDLDLLIRKSHLAQALQALGQLGYTRNRFFNDRCPGYWEHFGNELTLNPPDVNGLQVDLHWAIWEIADFYRLSSPALWQRSLKVSYQGLPVKLLAPEHALIYLCLHALSHFQADMLKHFNIWHIIDISLALTRLDLDWPQFLHDAGKFHCMAPIYRVFREVNNLLPGVMPFWVQRELSNYRPSPLEELALSRRLKHLTRCVVILNYHGFRDFLRFIRANLWPDSDYLAPIYGHSSHLLYLSQFFKRLFDTSQKLQDFGPKTGAD